MINGEETQNLSSTAVQKFIEIFQPPNPKLTAPQIEALINASQRSSSRHISRSTLQGRLCESDFTGKTPPLRKNN